MTKSGVIAVLSAILLAGCAVAAGAQPVPSVPDAEIVVRARQQQALREFVASVAEAGRSGQLGRWNIEICPSVIGIDEGQAGFMTRRIGEVAASLDLRTRASNCRTSMLIVVTDDAAALAQHFARTYPISLRTDGQARLNLFAATSRAVRWLSVSDLGGGVLPNSRLTLATHPEFQAMIVIVDARQISGFSLGELSDYVAMVALANPRATATREQGSILSMFDRPRPVDGPFALTRDDRNFLTGLYRINAQRSAQAQREAIARHMGRETPPDR